MDRLHRTARRSAAWMPLAALALGCGFALSACAPVGTPTAGPGVEPSDEAFDLDPATCLIGDWVISESELQAFYDQIADEGGPVFVVSGDSGLGFESSRYAYTPDLRLELDFSGMSGTGTLVGSIAGDYSVSDEVITTEHDDIDVDFDLDVDGLPMDASELFAEMVSANPISNAPYECTSDGPVIHFATIDGRIALQLSRPE